MHYGKYTPLTPNGLDEVIEEYDDDHNHLGFVSEEQRKQAGYDHYLSYYFDKWSKPQPVGEIRNFYRALSDSEFLNIRKFCTQN